MKGRGRKNADADNQWRQSSVKNVFIRGSVVRYVHLPAAAVDIPLLEDATRRGEFLYPNYMGCKGEGADLVIGKTEAEAQGGKGR